MELRHPSPNSTVSLIQRPHSQEKSAQWLFYQKRIEDDRWHQNIYGDMVELWDIMMKIIMKIMDDHYIGVSMNNN